VAELEAILDIAKSVVAFLQGNSSADELLKPIHRLVPYESAHISFWDPALAEHHVLVNDGYPDDVIRYLTRKYVASCPGYRFARTTGRAVRMQDTPFNFRETETYLCVLAPAGYREGVTLCLTTDESRYTGMLTLNVGNKGNPSEQACRHLDMLRSTLAQAADVLAALRKTASTFSPDCSLALMIDASGKILPLFDIDASKHYIRTHLSEFIPIVARFLRSSRQCYAFFLRTSELDTWHFVEIHRLPKHFWDSERVLLTATERVPPNGLTPRELEILAWLSEGLSNAAISLRVGTSVRTVSTHIEHILAKLGLQSRAAAAACAERFALRGFSSLSGADLLLAESD
jgi:DNA-binding NarL/FixJ family response regulator